LSQSASTFFRSDFRKDPYAYYSFLRRQSPIHFFDTGFWALSKYKDVVNALKRPDIFSCRTGILPGTPPGEDAPLHTKLRRITFRILSRRKLSVLEERMREVTQRVLARVRQESRFDLMSSLAFELPFSVLWEIVDVPLEIRSQCVQWLKELKPAPSLEKQLAELPLWKDCGEDLSSAERLRLLHFIFLAATETTRSLIGNTTLALLRNPAQMDLLRRNRELLPSLIEESLRYEAPAPFRERRTNQDVEIDGVKIPAGAFVFLLLGSANRDPEIFSNPDDFDITRDTSKHIAFGEGAHFCLGANLARLQAQVAMEGLLFQLKSLNPAESLQNVEYLSSFKLRSLKSLYLSI
jgi:cytochrome P450